MLTYIDFKFIFDSIPLGLSSSANIHQIADIALRVVLLLFLLWFSLLFCLVPAVVQHQSMSCRRGGGGETGHGWGFDCPCWPWGRAFDGSCSPRGGDIWIFLRLMWRYLTADSNEKDWARTYVSRFHASRMRRTVWKDLEIMEANGNKRKLSGFHFTVLSSNFVCFSVFLINWTS